MLENQQDDTFLSRWINNELTTEELEVFKNHPEYLHYEKIKQAAGLLDTTDYDEEAALNNLKTKFSSKKKSVIRLWPMYAAAVAASIAIIFGVFFFDSSATTIVADYGQQVAVTLPDGSEMLVNKNSTASFDEEKWEEDRSVKLDGEAYFKVQKGSAFTVKTANGDVTVLGTQFNVNAIQDMIAVVCYEGKVKVQTKDEADVILTPNMGMQKVGIASLTSFTTNESKPEWMIQKSVFRSIPARYVFIELEKQYQLQILIEKDVDQELIYSGSFPHNNLTIALQTVFSTLGLNYTLSPDKKTLVVNNK